MEHTGENEFIIALVMLFVVGTGLTIVTVIMFICEFITRRRQKK